MGEVSLDCSVQTPICVISAHLCCHPAALAAPGLDSPCSKWGKMLNRDRCKNQPQSKVT